MFNIFHWLIPVLFYILILFNFIDVGEAFYILEIKDKIVWQRQNNNNKISACAVLSTSPAYGRNIDSQGPKLFELWGTNEVF